jgi:hypothetical protein
MLTNTAGAALLIIALFAVFVTVTFTACTALFVYLKSN